MHNCIKIRRKPIMAKAEKKEAVVKEENVEAVEEKVEAAQAAAEGTAVATVNTEVAVKDEDEWDLEDLGFDDDELDALSGLTSINASDIRVPYAKLYSKVAKDRKLGDIELVDGTLIRGEEGEALEGLCILKIQTVRVYFPEKFSKDNTFICRSLDGIKGASDGEFAGTLCAKCKFAEYPEDGGSSPCREQLLLLCTDAEGTMFYLLVSGINVREFKRSFMSVDMMKGLGITKKKLKRNVLGALNIRVTVKMEDTDYGPFPVMQFRVVKEQPLVGKERLKGNLQALSSYLEFEQEAVESAATFAQTEQGEYADTDPVGATEGGDNDNAF